MWNRISWDPKQKYYGQLVKGVPIYEHKILVDEATSIPWGQHSSRTRKCSWDPLYETFIIVSNLMSTIVNLSSLLGKGKSSLLVNLLLS